MEINIENEIENNIDRIDVRLEAQIIFKELLNEIDRIVRGVIINDEEKANEIIKEIIISFLEISEGNYKEEKLSYVEKFERSRIQAAANREKGMRDYIKNKRQWKADINKRIEFNKRLLDINKKEKKSNETLKETIDRLQVTKR